MTVGVLQRRCSRLLRLLSDGLGTLIATPLVLIIRILGPVIRIRFGYFTSDRIGHFVRDAEYYLTEKALNVAHDKCLDLFFFEGAPANQQVALMCCRTFPVSPLIRFPYLANKLLFGSAHHCVLPLRARTNSRDKEGLFHRIPTQIRFTKEEHEKGSTYLKKFGLTHGDKFVCLIVRDREYLQKAHPGRNWSYHNFRDTNVENYREAVIALVEKGYFVFRMGKVVGKLFNFRHPFVIDYATSEDKNDFLDVWLVAHCHFLICTGLGLDSVADSFRRPKLLVNYLPLMDMEAWGNHITVPKKLTWSSGGRPLTLSEQVRHTSLNGDYYRNNGIQITDLSPSDITNAVLEMEARLSGTWIDTEEDELLNVRFWNQIRSYSEFSEYHGWIHPKARLGSHYLRESRDWFFEV